MQLFSAEAIQYIYVVFTKKSKTFFDPQNMKKLPSKVAHNQPPTFFCTGLAA